MKEKKMLCDACNKNEFDDLNLIKYIPSDKKKRKQWRVCNKCFKKVKKKLGLKK